MASQAEFLKELTPFIKNGARTDFKLVALEQVLAYLVETNATISNYSVAQDILNSEEFLNTLVLSVLDSFRLGANKAAAILCNLAATDKYHAKSLLAYKVDLQAEPLVDDGLYPINNHIVQICLHEIMNPSSPVSDRCCSLLSNLAHAESNAEIIMSLLEMWEKKPEFQENFTNKKLLNKLFSVYSSKDYNQHGATFDHLGYVFSNLSQTTRFRQLLLDRDATYVQNLLVFTQKEFSSERRWGAIRTVKNICFEKDAHAFLLGDDVNILTYLLLPLAGNEEFDEEDNDKLPIDLQYLPSDKERDEDVEKRIILLEALIQLSCKKTSREIMRDKNVYVILREYHKWEKNERAINICENLVNIIIRTEEEIGADDIKDVEIPPELTAKLEEPEPEPEPTS